MITPQDHTQIYKYLARKEIKPQKIGGLAILRNDQIQSPSKLFVISHFTSLHPTTTDT